MPTPAAPEVARVAPPAKTGGERFAGYAAVFDRADRSGDVIRRGAFAPVGPVPLLWQHDARRVAGTVEVIGEDQRGLRVIGRANGVRPGMGLSFGYRVLALRQAQRNRGEGTFRQLERLELIEVSLVRTPMQPLARVHAVETFQTEDEHGL